MSVHKGMHFLLRPAFCILGMSCLAACHDVARISTDSTVSSGISLRDWKLTLPVDKDHDGRADEVRNLQNYANPPWFQPSSGGLIFRVPAGGARTSSATAYARSELREMDSDGARAAWDCTQSRRVLILKQALIRTTVNKPEATIGQIHDTRNDNLMIRYRGPHHADGQHDTGRIEVRLNDSSSGEVLDNAYTLGQPMWISIAVDQGVLQVSYRNLQTGTERMVSGQLDADRVAGACYFKAGLYIQACSRTGLDGRENTVCARKAWPENRYDVPDAYAELRLFGLAVDK